ncbi:MAG: hypothetical protein ABFC90_03960 [Bacteroidales bacterium]|nr:hypothetical protein [Bacteroidales bacterium]
MKPMYLILLMIAALSFSNLNAQFVQKILFKSENSYQDKFIIDNGLEEIFALSQNHFVNDDGLTFNKKLMETSMDRIIPNKSQSGFASLDWEGYPYDVIRGVKGVDADDPKNIAFLNAFIAALNYAKFLRPNMKWCYYSMPPVSYSKYKEGNLEWVERCMPLLRAVDFLNPSLFLFYDGLDVDGMFVSQNIDAKIRYALELGKKLNKPVYPDVWQRYHPRSQTNGNKLIEVSTFTEFIRKVLNTENLNNRVNGISWWHCIGYLYRNQAGDPVLEAEFANVTNLGVYQIDLFQKYLDSLKPLFNYYNK